MFWASGRMYSAAVCCAVVVAIGVAVVDASARAGRCCAPDSCSRILRSRSLYCLVFFLFLAEDTGLIGACPSSLDSLLFCSTFIASCFSVVRQIVGNTKSPSGHAEARALHLPFNLQHMVPAPHRPFCSPGPPVLHASRPFVCGCPTRGLIRTIFCCVPLYFGRVLKPAGPTLASIRFFDADDLAV